MFRRRFRWPSLSRWLQRVRSAIQRNAEAAALVLERAGRGHASSTRLGINGHMGASADDFTMHLWDGQRWKLQRFKYEEE